MEARTLDRCINTVILLAGIGSLGAVHYKHETNKANNRPNCLKITKSTQKVNFTTVIDKDGNKIKTSVREARTMKKNNKKED